MKARPVSDAGPQRTSTSLLRPSQLALAGALCLAAGLGACKNEEGNLALPEALTEYLPEDRSVWPDSAGAVENRALASVCEDLWEFQMKSSPTWATYLNDPRYHGDLGDLRPTAALERNSVRRGFLSRLAGIARAKLSPADELTWQLVEHSLRDAIAREERDLGAWNLASRSGPQVQFLTLAADQPVGTPRERADLLSRWRSMATELRQRGRNLEAALDSGAVASRTQVEKVLAQLELLLATPAHLSPLVAPATGGGTWADLPPGGNVTAFAAEHLGDATRNQELRRINLHLSDGMTLAKGTPVLLPADDDILPPRLRGRFLADVWSIVDKDIYPAFREYKSVLQERILPRARPDERAGLLFVPNGPALYQQCIESFTTLELTPEEIHATGTAEVGRLTGEMVALGRKLFGTGAVADMRTLRAYLEGNPELHYSSREEIEDVAKAAVARMQAALPAAFYRVPDAPVEVVRVPAHEEAFTSMAYYRGPAPDGSRPGRYYVNTFDPPSKPRWEAEALAFHEAVPGHHLQIGLANELTHLPMVRRHMGIGAFVEGWALYTETLADELGVYSSDVDRLGMLSFDAWRSARLVVDTGIHALGWSRDRAIRYMEQNTLADRRNIENEVDRYISWPGQALGYKLGQLE
ncbi:MAG: DUF885 domain-containing protein, partial [Planctomycetota bacterium]|nr:DUF885 domain-containing protein [Planctomycetota bacterium]